MLYIVARFQNNNIRSDTTNTQTNGLTDLFIKRSIYFVKFVIIEMCEKLRSQRETMISLPKKCGHSCKDLMA